MIYILSGMDNVKKCYLRGKRVPADIHLKRRKVLTYLNIYRSVEIVKIVTNRGG